MQYGVLDEEFCMEPGSIKGGVVCQDARIAVHRGALAEMQLVLIYDNSLVGC